MKYIRVLVATTFALSLSSLAWARNVKNPPPASSMTTAATAATPTDAQISQIVLTADNLDIESAKLAKSRSKNKDIESFADLMVTDHTDSKNQVLELANKLKIKPANHATARDMQKNASEHMRKLKEAKGEFDREFIAHEVEFHQTVLDEMDKVLIPSAKNEELKALLEKTRPVIAAHLQQAEAIQSKLIK